VRRGAARPALTDRVPTSNDAKHSETQAAARHREAGLVEPTVTPTANPTAAPPAPPATAATGPDEAAPGRPSPPGRVPWGVADVALGGLIGFLPFAVLDAAAASTVRPETPDPGPVPGALPLLFAGVVTLWLYVWEAGFAWIFSLQRYRVTAAAWGLVGPPRSALWRVPVGLAVMLAFSIFYAGLVNVPSEDPGFPRSALGIIVLALTTCVIAPVFEEIVFRGFVFQGLIATFGPVFAGLLSATVFSLAHWDVQHFLPLLVCGLTLAWVYYSTRSLYSSIVLHALFNIVPTLVFVLAG
jgi:membrane protease YdiL (CAAX protease family)